jgi:hypothetical protein
MAFSSSDVIFVAGTGSDSTPANMGTILSAVAGTGTCGIVKMVTFVSSKVDGWPSTGIF